MAGPVIEGSLKAPIRHPIDWQNPEFYDEAALHKEMERVFDICHGCRRCVSLCQSFPTLFHLVDASESMEVDGVKKEDYGKVVEHCFLCDLCFMTKCPYVPPHGWNLDFPHLMLRAKAVYYRTKGAAFRDRALTNTDATGAPLANPVMAPVVNLINSIRPARKALEAVAGIDADAWLPEYAARPLRKRLNILATETQGEPAGRTTGKIALFATCYMNRNEPDPGEDFAAVFEHNGVPVTLTPREKCCGMPRLELGDFETVRMHKEVNIPVLAKLVDQGWDLTALVPSCVLMFKQELPLMFPGDEEVMKVKASFYDPFEYLVLRARKGVLKSDFKTSLGKVALHAACHQRVQNI